MYVNIGRYYIAHTSCRQNIMHEKWGLKGQLFWHKWGRLGSTCIQPNSTQRIGQIGYSDWLVDSKWPPGFENNSNGTTFHHHFYVKTIDNWSPSFFRHNTLSTTGVSNIALVQRTLMAICLHVPKPIITMTHDWSQNNVCDNRLAQWTMSVFIILTPISNSMR